MGLRGTLQFRKFKVVLNPTYRVVLNFAKTVTSCDTNGMHRETLFDGQTIKTVPSTLSQLPEGRIPCSLALQK